MPTLEAVVESHVQRWLTQRRLKELARREMESQAELQSLPPPITISYSHGSGGDEIAETVSQALGHQLFDREIVEAISRSTNIQTQIITLLDKGGQNLVKSLTDQLFSNRVMDDMSYTHTLIRIIRTISLIEPAVFIGRGACHILKDSDAFHVRIVADLAERIQRIVGMEGVTESEALDQIKSDDQMRKRFIRSNFNRDIDDPTAYHLAINTSRIPWLHASDLILSLYGNRPLPGSEMK